MIPLRPSYHGITSRSTIARYGCSGVGWGLGISHRGSVVR